MKPSQYRDNSDSGMNKLLLHRFYLLDFHLKDVDLQFLPGKIMKCLDSLSAELYLGKQAVTILKSFCSMMFRGINKREANSKHYPQRNNYTLEEIIKGNN